MSNDTRYISVEYIYKSIGLAARWQPDECPPYSYLNMMNGYERAENLLSTRYGTVIVNRDPVPNPLIGGTTLNYFFTSPVFALAKLTFQSVAYRYAGLADGSLWRRTATTGQALQGPYTQIAAPGTLAGLENENALTTVVTNCFETSQPYIFFYDLGASLKDNGQLAAPQLTGIDPSPYTLNAQPYSPLLTLIDSFASTNSYTTSGFSSAWAYSPITTIPAGNGQQIVDFSEFLNIGTLFTISGGSATATQSGFGNTSTQTVLSGFTSTPITAGEQVTLSLKLLGSATVGGGAVTGFASIVFQYSTDSGITWTSITNFNSSITSSTTFPAQNFTLVVNGLTNLSQLELRITANSTINFGPGTLVVTGTINSIQASVATAGIFGEIANGMLSILNTSTTLNVAIVNVVSTLQLGGLYTTLTITTQSPHGLTGTPMISVYGSSNDLVDGFYQATVTGTTTLTVPYLSPVLLSATGGFLHGGQTAPAVCALVNQYSIPYPTQMSAWGFYQQVPLATTSFPVSCWSGMVAAGTTATVGQTVALDLSINNQVNDSDLIVLTLQVGTPANVSNIRLQFDVNGSGYTSSWYYKDIAPAFYQGNVANTVSAYESTQSQILADTLGLITGQPPATTTAQLQPGNFSTGEGTWVAVIVPRGNFLPVGSAGQSGLDWSNITGWQVVIETLATNSGGGSSTVACNGLYLQWGYGPSSFAGIGYDYRYTGYNIATGTESSPSPEMEFGGKQFGYLSSQSAPFYLRQAVQLTAQYFSDPQVTHLRVYRRGGTLASNWLQIDQVPNITAGGTFFYKDVVPDASLQESTPLILDNDPPVTSSLVDPISLPIAAATTGPSNTYYSTFQPQIITTSVAGPGVTYLPNQVVDVGNSANLEQVLVITGGTDQFTAILRLQHNAGEPVNVYATPRTKCNLSALAYNRVWLAGDKTNPHYLYFSKVGLPENFSPAAYIPCGSPNHPIVLIVNWRGTLFVATDETWYVIVGGAQPYAQPTGSTHGAVASLGWTEMEGGIPYRASDGIRIFSGADGAYLSLPIEWIYRQQPFGPLPLADPTSINLDVMAYYNNMIYVSYESENQPIMPGVDQRYRLVFDTSYKRWRIDDLAATAMLWERDTNQFLIGIPVPGQVGAPTKFCVAQDQVYTQDYDDGGWQGVSPNGTLVKVPITLTEQSPYRDLGKPHFPKQFNVVELDVNTFGQSLTTTLLFLTEPPTSLVLPTITTSQRQKVQLQVEQGEGQPAYSVAVQHTISATTAPLIYQENIYAALLADYRSSYDSYWIKFGTDQSKVVKQAYFDYTSTTTITVELFADDGSGAGSGSSLIPYFTFTLPAQPNRESIRVLFPAKKCRIWRLVMTCSAPFQLWEAIQVEFKQVKWGSTFSITELAL